MRKNFTNAINDAKRQIYAIESKTISEVVHWQDRPFSKIYRLLPNDPNSQREYILKISTTSRQCEDEFKMYSLLIDNDINSLRPVTYSNAHNYIITKREQLQPFDLVIKKCQSKTSIYQYFEQLGNFFNEIDQKLSHESEFNFDQYVSYLFPRLEKVDSIDPKQGDIIKHKVLALKPALENRPTRNTLVSDFALGNINLDKRSQILILDMGDARIDNVHLNIAYVQLNILYGSLGQYVANHAFREKLFQQYLAGYVSNQYDRLQFDLFRISHLVNMILFVENIPVTQFFTGRRLVSKLANKYLGNRYKAHTIQICRGLK